MADKAQKEKQPRNTKGRKPKAVAEPGVAQEPSVPQGPLTDAEFMTLAKEGRPLPKEMTPTQKQWLERFQASSAGRARGIDQEEQPVEPADAQAEDQPDDDDDSEPQEQEAPATGVLPPREVQTPHPEEEPDVEAEDDEEEDATEPAQKLPPFELPSKRPADRSDGPPPTARPSYRPPNDLGLFVSEEDDCYHHNKSWKGGCCTIQGNQACPFQGGNQHTCRIYKHIEEGRAEARQSRL